MTYFIYYIILDTKYNVKQNKREKPIKAQDFLDPFTFLHIYWSEGVKPMNPDRPIVCVAAIGSMTLCMKAQRVLSAAGINAHVISLSPEETKRGCAFGISFPTNVQPIAAAQLRRAKIPVSEYFTKEHRMP